MPEYVEGSILPAPSEKALEDLNWETERDLPKSYIEFLKEANGAKLKNYDVTVGGKNFVIEFFLPVIEDYKEHPRGWADIGVVIAQLTGRLSENGDAFGVDLIPIASLFAGNFLVLDYRRNADCPEVCYWDHELSKELKPFAVPISGSFEEFLAQLH